MLCHPLQLKSFRCSLFRLKNRSEMQNFWNLSNFISHFYITSKLNGSLNGSATYSKFKPAKIVKIGNVHGVFKKRTQNSYQYLVNIPQCGTKWKLDHSVVSPWQEETTKFSGYLLFQLVCTHIAWKQATYMIWFK